MRLVTISLFMILMMATDILAKEFSADEYAAARAALVREIEADVRATKSYLGSDTLDPRVIAALAKVPRHEFVPADLRRLAYNDHPLPIGYDQTISQPYIVAVMTDLLQVFEGGQVLEVGTGSGYQAAVLGEVCAAVYSIEIVAPLGERSGALLKKLGYDNVHTKIGDGYAGWPEHAPYDGIIVTAAASHVPKPLLEQLRPGGRMVIPVKQGFGSQQLLLIEKADDGTVNETKVLPVRFVPLTRQPENK
jgi:protein-L-isoaspartate(D-aspartate) O-methyltransferase